VVIYFLALIFSLFYQTGMNKYSKAIAGYLAKSDITQIAFAVSINKSAVAVHRYVQGHRFPDAKTAKAISKATGGKIPFEAWEAVAKQRMGISA